MARDTVGSAAREIATEGGRARGLDLEATLSLRSLALLDVVNDEALGPTDQPAPACHLAAYVHGGVYLSTEAPRGRDLESRGACPLSASQLDAIRVATLTRLAAEAPHEAQLAAWLERADFGELLDSVTRAVRHSDPHLLWCDGVLFTNYDRHNNLLAKPGVPHGGRYLLDRAEFTPFERRFIAGAALLLGADLKIEEFNGRELRPATLASFFAQKHRQYTTILGVRSFPESLPAQAALLSELRAEASTHRVPYRWIDALSFRKEERWRTRGNTAVPMALLDHFGLDADHFYDALAERISGRDEALAETIEVIVRAAMTAIPSHLGMARGPRDLGYLRDALEAGRDAEIAASPIDDGYCAVFPRDDAHALYADPPLAKVLAAVSRRMMFNHRHYLPGHFTEAEAPGRPHFYNPPAMADIAEWGESRHVGHQMARVRFSLRSPAPVRLAGRSLTGLVDLRLMRASGQPYTEADLAVAASFSEALAHLAEAIAARPGPTPVVQGFNREDYERRYPSPPRALAADVPRDIPGIGALLRAALAAHPDTIGIIDGRTGHRHAALDIEAAAASVAAATGGRPGARVSICCRDRTQQALWIVATLVAGAVACPLDPASATFARLLAHADAAVVIGDSLPTGRAQLPPPGDEGLLVYTSGTTRAPRGVPLHATQLAANISFAREHFGYGPGWRSGCLLPLHHTFALASDLLPVLLAGGEVVVLPAFDPANFVPWPELHSFSAVPLLLDALLALGAPVPRALRFAISGAAPLSERTRERYLSRHGHPVVPCYGLTETVCFATASPVDAIRPGSVGKPAAMSLRVLGDDHAPLPPGERGEIALRGPAVMTGSYAASAATPVEEGWLLTGDIGHVDHDGYVYITGRRKNMLIRGGEKVYLEEVERCLAEHPAVAEAVCAVHPGPFGWERGVAYLVSRPGAARPGDDILRALVRDALGALGEPDEIRWIDRVPRGATGKPLRSLLEAPCR